ncbi:3-methyl-2-oxobutanoate hydroxymethyltransferase [Nonomuraea sp. K274]|uniref:3-methyl-2-oxobutanoate hydroxymethyltransferase n=1 Tax=Nonomuraea cypriaca TaxID=1187855 RepID=A0A931A8T3_9ACTN|nr:3-methyl-2-oxobutanoate hydroxymethyltransferase [Nonomuraea cypriaca]MBF8185485.1 3-methyl-2-oxobutanoate hydroxymethyltransferase [Nonomuraea cypriaca]
MTQSRLVSSCARAATAEEAAFRIDYPLAAARNTRVVALDAAAGEIVRQAAQTQWAQARFYSAVDPGHSLVTMSGERVPLVGELEDSNTLVLVSTNGENTEAAATIGAACKVRGIMTAGLAVTPGQLTSEALFALRPYARILLVPAEEDDLFELLRATRA